MPTTAVITDGGASGGAAGRASADASKPGHQAQADAQGVTDAPDGSAPRPADPCPGGTVNACGGCDVLEHSVDETCNNGGMGPCALPGSYRCLDTKLICTAPPPTPGLEECDGMDNDCDGMIDEGVSNACGGCVLKHKLDEACDNGGTGQCLQSGTFQCAGTKLECNAPAVGDCTPATVVDIAVGANHACAVLSTGALKCWGYNQAGQLGLPPSESEASTTVAGLSDVVQAAAGFVHTCARLKNGTVSCWGNTHAYTDPAVPAPSSTPVLVAGITDAEFISAGTYSTCVVRKDRTVLCWGSIGGLGKATRSNVPSIVAGLANVGAVAASLDHVCAAPSAAVVRCRGNNQNGQLGDGSQTDSATPVSVASNAVASAVAVGDQHSCSLSLGNVSCWGSNVSGQLGQGAVGLSSNFLVPKLVPNLSDVRSLAAASSSSCAVLKTGGVSCWGAIPRVTGAVASPTPVMTIANAVSVGVGESFACARTMDSHVKCWGSNGQGQLGVAPSTLASSLAAVEIPNLQ